MSEESMTTEIKIGNPAFFLMQNKVVSAIIQEIVTTQTAQGVKIRYTIDKNPVGENYTKYWERGEIFESKQDLLNSL